MRGLPCDSVLQNLSRMKSLCRENRSLTQYFRVIIAKARTKSRLRSRGNSRKIKAKPTAQLTATGTNSEVTQANCEKKTSNL